MKIKIYVVQFTKGSKVRANAFPTQKEMLAFARDKQKSGHEVIINPANVTKTKLGFIGMFNHYMNQVS